MAIITLRGIEKVYRTKEIETTALENVNLEVEAGEFVSIMGPSGCGKSTTLRMIAGLEEISGGELFIDGKQMNDVAPKDRDIAMVFQNYALSPHMTVYENIAYGLKLRGNIPDIKVRVNESLIQVGLDPEKFAKRAWYQLSGGEAQRVALAARLALRPRVLLLDEPLGALDLKLRKEMQLELKRLQREMNITFVYVTHDQEEAMALSHRIVVMNKGKFEQVGTPTEVYDNPATKYVASFIGEMNFIEKDGKTIAVRPEDVAITSEPADIQGCVRTIMVLGHYVEVNVQCGDLVVKCFVDRDQSERLTPGDPVNLKFLKTHIF